VTPREKKKKDFTAKKGQEEPVLNSESLGPRTPILRKLIDQRGKKKGVVGGRKRALSASVQGVHRGLSKTSVFEEVGITEKGTVNGGMRKKIKKKVLGGGREKKVCL